MIRRTVPLLIIALSLPIFGTTGAIAADSECELTPRTQCFGIESVQASLSNTEAGAHPDLTFSFDIKHDPEGKPNPFGLRNGYATTRQVRFELPPGLIGDPNVLGVPQQCTVQELATFADPGGGCPNGSQVGISTVSTYEAGTLLEPIYMMAPPGGDVVARLGFVAGLFPIFVDLRIRSEGDYGIVAEISDAPTAARLLKAETTTWGVPSDPSHDTERCTPAETLFGGCVKSVPRPPGSRPLPFLTNPTRCGASLIMQVGASSWSEPQRFDTKSATFPQIEACNRLPFGPSLTVEPTNHRPAAPTGLNMTIRLPASDGVKVLEPSQMRYIKITLPQGLVFNPSAGDGLATCNEGQVHFGERVASDCPDASKLAGTEFDVAALSRRMKGAIYLREPVPGNPFRIWVVADDLGLHIKLPGQLHVDSRSGQVESIVVGTPQTEGIPQAPVREVGIALKSGLRAPLASPSFCGTFHTEYEITPWSGGPTHKSSSPMTIDEDCDGVGGFSPKLSGGTTDSAGGAHSRFTFMLTRRDGEQNPLSLDIALPTGLAATFAGMPRCAGAAAEIGQCPAGSRIGKVTAAIGVGPAPLWVPQSGKRPTAVYLAGPYRGGPLSIVAVVPRQAGPFDFGDEIVRSALYVNRSTGQVTVKADPLPQIIEGIPIMYRAVNVDIDRPAFTLNPTSCAPKSIEATVASPGGSVAHPTAPFAATNCARLPFKPRLAIHLRGGTRRGGHPSLRAVLRGRSGDANIAGTSVALPHSEFLDQGHIKTVCTRVQFAAGACPAGSIYGHAKAKSPLFDEVLSGPVYLRSSSHSLPDLVIALKGPDTLPIEIELAGRIDSVNGGIRSTFDVVPDAPVSSFVLSMQGGKKGLLVNSTDICAKPQEVTVDFSGQNGRRSIQHPLLQASCGKHQRRPTGR